MATSPLKFKVTMKATVVCFHDVEKRKVLQLESRKNKHVKLCPCCQNLYEDDLGDKNVNCHSCRMKGVLE